MIIWLSGEKPCQGKPNNLNSIPGAHIKVEAVNQLHKVVLLCLHVSYGTLMTPYTYHPYTVMQNVTWDMSAAGTKSVEVKPNTSTQTQVIRKEGCVTWSKFKTKGVGWNPGHPHYLFLFIVGCVLTAFLPVYAHVGSTTATVFHWSFKENPGLSFCILWFLTLFLPSSHSLHVDQRNFSDPSDIPLLQLRTLLLSE